VSLVTGRPNYRTFNRDLDPGHWSKQHPEQDLGIGLEIPRDDDLTGELRNGSIAGSVEIPNGWAFPARTQPRTFTTVSLRQSLCASQASW